MIESRNIFTAGAEFLPAAPAVYFLNTLEEN
jgi:hypothetical protein